MKKKHLKIAVIGGGSSYTPELVEGLIRYHDEFPVAELYLADIEAGADKLRIIGELAQRMIDASGKPIRLHTTLDRREAIRGADFVATQIRVGMLDARSRDEKIPLAHHLIGQETTGAGGFAKALRTIPVILDICRDIEELAPGAFMINFTNPAGIITEAVSKHSRVKSVGLCNLPISTKMQIAELYGVPQSEMFIEIVGINHLNWTTRVLIEGEDVTEDFLNKLSGAKGPSMANIPDLEWDSEFIQSVGALPCPYHRYYYMKEEMYREISEHYQESGKTRADDVKEVEAELFEIYKQPEVNSKPAQLEKRGGAYYSEAAVQLMKSIYNDTGDIQTVNVRNQGLFRIFRVMSPLRSTVSSNPMGRMRLHQASHFPADPRSAAGSEGLRGVDHRCCSKRRLCLCTAGPDDPSAGRRRADRQGSTGRHSGAECRVPAPIPGAGQINPGITASAPFCSAD